MPHDDTDAQQDHGPTRPTEEERRAQIIRKEAQDAALERQVRERQGR